MIIDLFRSKQINEPKSVKIFRIFIVGIAIALLIAIFIILCVEVIEEQPSIRTTYTEADSLPLPNIYFSHTYNFTIYCAFINDLTTQAGSDCGDSVAISGSAPYFGGFSSNYNVTSATGSTQFDLFFYITDPGYNASNLSNSMVMFAFDREFDIYSGDFSGTPTPFEQSLSDKNEYFLSQPTEDRIVLSLLGIIGGIWSALTAFYIFLFGLGLISPWGFVQRSKPFKDQYQKDIITTTLDLSDKKEKLNNEEHEISLAQKRQDYDLEKRVERLESFIKFYGEYVIDTSFLTSVNMDSTPEER
ncbi:11960_t:CDS:2 [Dentiscutata erythropus]|uniref:11960_t:CDS:1 n=1 Tax=Dentiscutata erythropus TaxID=1348616 RepID=A0A9N8VAK4_9GLOM|nr:11960_t:CDS:2 [Dentiscutata erythropus]